MALGGGEGKTGVRNTVGWETINSEATHIKTKAI